MTEQKPCKFNPYHMAMDYSRVTGVNIIAAVFLSINAIQNYQEHVDPSVYLP